MAYTQKTWVSGETPLSAENMNHIEQGVADAHNDISSLNTKIIHYKDVEIKLNTVTWKKSTQGLYYSSEVTVSDVKAILGLAILNFGYLTAEQHIVPVLATTESRIRFTASTSSFSDSAFLKLRLLYID